MRIQIRRVKQVERIINSWLLDQMTESFTPKDEQTLKDFYLRRL